MQLNELKEFLDQKVIQYNQSEFINSDPIQIPHRFSIKEDIEIAAFIMASLAWGNRKTIINKGNELMSLMDNAPYDFVINHSEGDLKALQSFKHRTFNGNDIIFFLTSLKHIYLQHQGLENSFQIREEDEDTFHAITSFRSLFLATTHEKRAEKHISSPAKGSAAKRINMFLRWMVRRDEQGVDFGLWKTIPMSILVCPLDVHTQNTARKLNLLQRKQNDWKAAIELHNNLKQLDPNDPSKYDFALFGLGIFEVF